MSKTLLAMIAALSLIISAAIPAAAGYGGYSHQGHGLHHRYYHGHRHGHWHFGYVHWRHNYLHHRHW